MLFPALLSAHILSGAVALLAAVLAMASRKQGGALHARAGRWFVRSMSAMAASAAVLTWWEPDPLSLGAALWTLYLVQTAQAAALRRDGGFDRAARLALVPGTAALSVFACGAVLAWRDGSWFGSGPEGYLVFGSLTALSLGLDVSLRWRGALPARARIARHLWRMGMACFLAVTSLFLGQQDDVFPFMAGSPVLLTPPLAALLFTAFWLARVRFARHWLRPVLGGRGGRSLTTIEKEFA